MSWCVKSVVHTAVGKTFLLAYILDSKYLVREKVNCSPHR